MNTKFTPIITIITDAISTDYPDRDAVKDALYDTQKINMSDETKAQMGKLHECTLIYLSNHAIWLDGIQPEFAAETNMSADEIECAKSEMHYQMDAAKCALESALNHFSSAE